ncbi:ComEC/Rec2 family competence protein [Qipengyuania flava]|uniref:hypothetical protein n=1 Tax=Qipengyuania flava TaxID=192812 RepID=UPI001C594594|nr:hypothetical protein [Qipengyuania flava]MBW3169409.1 hypothetical protein [Qipengyuania flava]MBY5966647.1 hypothetical protein [Qipengyuania flava]MBY6012971.1 hypothetical protein [Qipengyuania flava]MBY6027413.1 hypothetical protein [Qipengyuania flava]
MFAHQPTRGVSGISGVTIEDVGQGDAVRVLDLFGATILWIDYGGRQGNPFQGVRRRTVDRFLHVRPSDLVMLTHWDEDHWCSARKGVTARDADWLVPRQTASPRAARFSAKLASIRCIPESVVGLVHEFGTGGGDRVRWEKIARWPGPDARNEDCNLTGVAFSVLHERDDGVTEVILLPGDAPCEAVGHFHGYVDDAFEVRGMVASHHGSGAHWPKATVELLKHLDPDHVVFSCSDPNAYGHPDRAKWSAALPNAEFRDTAEARRDGRRSLDLLFTDR